MKHEQALIPAHQVDLVEIRAKVDQMAEHAQGILDAAKAIEVKDPHSEVQASKILLILVKPTIILQEEAEAEAIAALDSTF